MTDLKNIETAIQETLAITVNFRAIIEKETEVLKKADFKKMEEFAHLKKEASEKYKNAIMTLTPFAKEFKRLPASIKDSLKAEKMLFDKAVLANRRTLEKANITTKRLSDRIISIAQRAIESNNLGYTQQGAMQQQSANVRPAYMSLNEML